MPERRSGSGAAGWTLFAVVLVCCMTPSSGARWGNARACNGQASTPSDSDVVGAFAAATAMIFVLKEQQQQIADTLESLVSPSQAFTPCSSGRGVFNDSGLWFPAPVGAVTAPETVHGVFYPGAEKHLITGYRALSPVLGTNGSHAENFLSTTVNAAHQALENIVAYFKVRGAPTLGSALSIKEVRTRLSQFRVGDSTLVNCLRHIANAADAVRHLTMFRIRTCMEVLEDALASMRAADSPEAHLPKYDETVLFLLQRA